MSDRLPALIELLDSPDLRQLIGSLIPYHGLTQTPDAE